MDMKAEIEKIIAMLTKDVDFKELFSKDPSEAVRGVIGDKADKDTVEKIVEAVKSLAGKVDFSKIDFSKIDMSKIDLGDITGKLGGLLGGKKEEKKEDQ